MLFVALKSAFSFQSYVVKTRNTLACCVMISEAVWPLLPNHTLSTALKSLLSLAELSS